MVIEAQGLTFLRDGRPATYAGQDSFRLLDRFLRGEDIAPVMESCQRVIKEIVDQGIWIIPVLRVLGVMKNICQLQPSMYGNYYTSVSALTDHARDDYGFLIDWDVNADEQHDSYGWGWSEQQQHDHSGQFADATRGRTPFYTLVNEGPKNGIDHPEKFQRPDGFISSKGSNLGGDYPPPDPWGMHKYHPRRDNIKGIAACGRYICFVAGGDDEATPKWPRSTVPVVTDEWLGAADQDEHGRRTSWPDDHYRAAFDMAAWGAGGTFHSDCGIQSVPYSQRQFDCGLAHFMGLSKADPVQRFGGIVR